MDLSPVNGLTAGVELGGLVMRGRAEGLPIVLRAVEDMDVDTLRRLLFTAVGVLGHSRMVEAWASLADEGPREAA